MRVEYRRMRALETFEVLPFFRGISDARLHDSSLILETRKDRKPRDTPLELHERADSWFAAQFGTRYRSQALFVTSSISTARSYVKADKHVARILPLGPYKFCWSPLVSDMLMLAVDFPEADVFERELGRRQYQELDLHGAHSSGNEVMLYCERYIAVPVHLLDAGGSTDVDITNGAGLP